MRCDRVLKSFSRWLAMSPAMRECFWLAAFGWQGTLLDEIYSNGSKFQGSGVRERTQQDLRACFQGFVLAKRNVRQHLHAESKAKTKTLTKFP